MVAIQKTVRTVEKRTTWLSDNYEELLAQVKMLKEQDGAQFMYYGSMYSDAQHIHRIEDGPNAGRYVAVQISKTEEVHPGCDLDRFSVDIA